MTITQNVEIPENRRLHLELEIPREIPTGKARFEYKVIPFVNKEEEPVDKDEPPLKCLIGVDTSLVDSLAGIISNPENKTYDELRFEGMMEKYGDYFSNKTISDALALRWKDFEDTVQFVTAKENFVDLIITRNKADFEVNDIPCMTPAEFIAYIKEKEEAEN